LVASRAIEKARASFNLRHEAPLDTQVDEPTQLALEREQILNQQQTELARQQDLLALDHDIRELMGPRDLNIAKVRDAAGNAKSDKTYRSVFYTKGKSLIFCAYDSNSEAGLKTGNRSRLGDATASTGSKHSVWASSTKTIQARRGGS
jgi:hypothetical protein